MKLNPGLEQKSSRALARVMPQVSGSEMATAMSACAHNGPPLEGPLWNATAEMLVARAQDLSEANVCRALQAIVLSGVPVSELLAAALRGRVLQLLDTLRAGSLATMMKTLPTAGVAVPHDSALGAALQRKMLHMLRYERRIPEQHVGGIVLGFARTHLPATPDLRAAMERRLHQAGLMPGAAKEALTAAMRQLGLFEEYSGGGEVAADVEARAPHSTGDCARAAAGGVGLMNGVPGISAAATPSAAGARVPEAVRS